MTQAPPLKFLADSSAWIEMLRATGSVLDRVLTGALRDGQSVMVTGIVVQEVLSGSRDESHADALRRLMEPCGVLGAVYPATYEHAAALSRRCRAAGKTVRGTVDCLIAAVALEHRATVLAADRDMATLHFVCGLDIWPPPE